MAVVRFMLGYMPHDNYKLYFCMLDRHTGPYCEELKPTTTANVTIIEHRKYVKMNILLDYAFGVLLIFDIFFGQQLLNSCVDFKSMRELSNCRPKEYVLWHHISQIILPSKCFVAQYLLNYQVNAQTTRKNPHYFDISVSWLHRIYWLSHSICPNLYVPFDKIVYLIQWQRDCFTSLPSI